MVLGLAYAHPIAQSAAQIRAQHERIAALLPLGADTADARVFSRSWRTAGPRHHERPRSRARLADASCGDGPAGAGRNRSTPQKLKPEQVKWALVKTKYNITRAAMLFGVARVTIREYIERYPELLGAELKAEVIAMICDRARDVVFKAVDQKEDVRTSVHVLRTHEAGWEPKQNIEHTGVVQHALQGAALMSREQVAAMDENELKKMFAVREAERADGGTELSRIEAAMAATEAEAGPDRPGPSDDEAGGSETAV